MNLGFEEGGREGGRENEMSACLTAGAERMSEE